MNGCKKKTKPQIDPSKRVEVAYDQLESMILNSLDWAYYLPSVSEWASSNLITKDSFSKLLLYIPSKSLTKVNLCLTLDKPTKTHLFLCYKDSCQEILFALISSSINKKFEIKKKVKDIDTYIIVPENSDDVIYYSTLEDIQKKLFCENNKLFSGVIINVLNASGRKICVYAPSLESTAVFSDKTLFSVFEVDSETLEIAPVQDGLCNFALHCCITFKTAYLADKDKDSYVYLTDFPVSSLGCPACELKDRSSVITDATLPD